MGGFNQQEEYEVSFIMDFNVGDTFFADYPKNDPHLFFIIIDADYKNPELFICTMLSSWKDFSPHCDDACIVNEGEHPFVRHKSYIAYSETMVLTRDDLERFVLQGSFKRNEPATPALVKKIIDAASKSKKILPEIRDYILEYKLRH